MITISHTHADGTLIDGSARGDGVYEILTGLRDNWRYFHSIRRIGLGQPRDRTADTPKINRAASALRSAGHEVTVTIDDSDRRDVAEVEADRAARAAGRAGRLGERAERRGAQADADYQRARQMGAAIPFGQPVMPGHHSYSRDMNYRARMGRTYDRAFEGMREARELERRAGAAGATQAHRESIPATLRRIERLEAEARQVQRRLDGSGLAMHGEDEPATDAYAERLTARAADLAEQLAYWRDHVAQAEASGVKVWSSADFTKGDYVRSGGRWYQVERVNLKSLSVPHGNNDHLLPVVTRDKVTHAMGPSQWVWKITYDDVTGRKSAEEMTASLAGPGPVEIARH